MSNFIAAAFVNASILIDVEEDEPEEDIAGCN
jgi:hypothetical protein